MATQLFQPPHGSPAWFYGCVDRAEKAGGVVTERVALGPELAAEMLKQNPHNRFVRNQKMQHLAADIRGGRWIFNGEPILISKEGLLNDGQHRASAVIETNIPIDVLMVFGLERSSRTTVDQGVARTTSDYLSMDGVHNAVVAASIARLVVSLEKADMKSLANTSMVSNGEVVARVHSDDRIGLSATFAGSLHTYAKKLAPPSVIGCCHYLMSRICAGQADAFLHQVGIGESLKKKDPAFAVREALFRERLTRTEKMHVIFRGWNAYRQSRALSLVKVVGNLPALI